MLQNSPAVARDYQQRLEERQQRLTRLQRLEQATGVVRLTLAAIVVVLVCLALIGHLFSLLWALLPTVAFVAAALSSSAWRRGRERAQAAVEYCARALARVEDRWTGQGRDGTQFEDPHHVYSADLDLFGRGSLFQLLSQARTRMGEQTLADWLTRPASRQQILQRQQCVLELRDRRALREQLSVLGATIDIGVQPQELLSWAESGNALTGRWIGAAARVLPILVLLAAACWGFFDVIWPLPLVLLIELLVYAVLSRPVRTVLERTEHAFADLQLFATLLGRIEREPFESASLKQLVLDLASAGTQSASRHIAQLDSIDGFAGSRRNLIVKVFEVPLLYSLHVARAAERWRALHGRQVRAWIEAVGRFEALCSLATYAYEHPGDPMPELRDGPPVFEAEALGHPLIPAARCVRNDVAVGGEQAAVLLVSGSNMSGKSTLLRAVGTNVVLAMAGAPVRAARLGLTPLQIGASIRVNDSLQEGSSRFYAEISRLRQLYELAGGQPPLLFLLDELLQGTNSMDRRIGAQGILLGLLRRHAIGFATTHDLALTELTGLSGGALRNEHFQDRLQDGHMKFDYRLREGVVTHSNGLELMRSMGLEV